MEPSLISAAAASAHIANTRTIWLQYSWTQLENIKIRMRDIIINNTTGDVAAVELSKLFYYMVDGNIITIDDIGDGFIWDKCSLVWVKNSAHRLARYIHNNNSLIMQAVRDLMVEYAHYSTQGSYTERSKVQINSCMKLVQVLWDKLITTEFVEEIYNASKHYFRRDFSILWSHTTSYWIPIKNGKFYNLETHEIRHRKRSDYCTFRYLLTDDREVVGVTGDIVDCTNDYFEIPDDTSHIGFSD